MVTAVQGRPTGADRAVYVPGNSLVVDGVTMDGASQTAQEADVEGFDVRRELLPTFWSSGTAVPLRGRKR